MLLRFQQRFLSRRPHLVFCAFRHRIQSTLSVTGAATLSVTFLCHAGRNVVVHSLCHGCRHVVVCACCDAVCDSLCHAAGGPSHSFDKCRHAVIDGCCDGCRHVVVDACCGAGCDSDCNAECGSNHNFDRCRHVAVDAFGDGCCYVFSNAFCHACRHLVFCAFCHRMRHGFVYACCCASCDILCNAECGSSHNFDRYRYAVIDVCCDGPAFSATLRVAQTTALTSAATLSSWLL